MVGDAKEVFSRSTLRRLPAYYGPDGCQRAPAALLGNTRGHRVQPNVPKVANNRTYDVAVVLSST